MSDQERDNRCPLCGKKMDAEEAFCGDCREIADNAYPDELLSRSEKEEVEKKTDIAIDTFIEEKSDEIEEDESDEIRPKKKNGKLLAFILIGAVLIVLVGGIGSYILVQNRDAEETQDAYWNESEKENTPLSYSKYLVQYPEGKYSEQAQNKIVELREKEKQTWNKLSSVGSEDALFAFLKEYPDSPYTVNVRHKIDSLAWATSEKKNTKEAYLAYLQKSVSGTYNGDHVDVAQQRYDYFNQMKSVEGEELGGIIKSISNFFKALSATDSKNIQKYSNPILDIFYESQLQASKDIADSIKSSLKTNKIRRVSYTPQSEPKEAIKDNKGLVFITLTVDVEIVFTDRKKKKEDKQQILSIILNEEKLIQSVEEKTE